MKLTLFLDFDGVLHPEYCADSQHFEQAHLLVECLAAYPAVEIVISSTWRERYTLTELTELLPESLSARVVGVTPGTGEMNAVPDRLLGYARHAQCWQWQRDHKDASDLWLALDDRKWLFYPMTKHLIECDSSRGLTLESVSKLDIALRVLTVSV